MELQGYLRTLRKRWRWVLFVLLLSISASAVYTTLRPRVYQTSTRLMFTGDSRADPSVALTVGSLAQQRVASYADLVESRRVTDPVRAVVGTMGLPGAPIIEARQIGTTVIMQVVVSDRSPARAQATALAIGEVFPKIVEDLERSPAGGPPPIRASVIEPPPLPTKPAIPKTTVSLIIGALLGLMAGIAAALIADLLDNTVKTDQDLEEVLPGVRPIGVIPFDAEAAAGRLVTLRHPRSRVAERFRQTRTNIEFLGVDEPVHSIVVTSSVPSEGKSRLSANLAVTIAQGGQRVCLVDADLRKPSLGEYLGLVSPVGLTSVLVGLTPLDTALQPWADGLVSVLPSGPLPPNPSELLGSQAMLEVIAGLESRFDVVIFDTPPLLPVTDAAILAASVNGVVLVARSNKTTREQVERAAQVLDTVGARMLGPIINFAPEGASDAYAGTYGYYRGSEQPTNTASEVRPAQRARRRSRASVDAVLAGATDPAPQRAARERVAEGVRVEQVASRGPARVGGAAAGPSRRRPAEIDSDVAVRALRAVQAQRSRWQRVPDTSTGAPTGNGAVTTGPPAPAVAVEPPAPPARPSDGGTVEHPPRYPS